MNNNIRTPIWRTVIFPDGKPFRTTLKEPCYCDKCEKITLSVYSTPTPDDRAYWYCEECENEIFLEKKQMKCPNCNSDNIIIQDDSFSHEFGTEEIIYPVCDDCGYSDDDWNLEGKE